MKNKAATKSKMATDSKLVTEIEMVMENWKAKEKEDGGGPPNDW